MELKDKVQFGLDENRILVLGAQLVLGFQFRSVFEPGFERLSRLAQWVDWLGLLAMALAVTVLISAPTFHRIAEGGEDTPRFDQVLGEGAATGYCMIDQRKVRWYATIAA